MRLFVPGRICLFGEHSDWAGGYRRLNADIEKGYTLICGTDQARQECDRLGLKYAALESEVRDVVGELIKMETRNGEVLAGKRKAAEVERAQLDRSRSNLKRVHQSYGSPRAAAWSSFS